MTDFRPGVALIVVDVQNDFADPAGSLYVPAGEHVIATVNGQVAEARAAGAHVVLTQDWHPEHTPHFAQDGGIWPVHCVRDTWGAAFHPDLVVPDDAPVIRKGTNGEDGYSAFTMRDPTTSEVIPTALDPLLREAGVDEVIVIGLATDYCIKATVLDALELGYKAQLLQDAVAAVDLKAGDGDAAIETVRDAGCQIGWTVPPRRRAAPTPTPTA
jgi:nicotinamidase/pyrazinamidase